jgi:hypothetical protein
MPRFGRINYFINDNIKYVCKGGDSRPGNGRIIFILDIVECNDVQGASSLGNRAIKYLYKRYCRIY